MSVECKERKRDWKVPFHLCCKTQLCGLVFEASVGIHDAFGFTVALDGPHSLLFPQVSLGPSASVGFLPREVLSSPPISPSPR